MSSTPVQDVSSAFSQPDIFYPIVPDFDWLKRIVPLGVRTVQLRLKDVTPAEIERQLAQSLDVCANYDCQLVVNDYWHAAIEAGAHYVHLGQEDLASADLYAIRDAGIRFGLSTHSHEELEIALAAQPDYVALGPVFETKLKAMKWEPQGLDRVGEWKRLVGDLPLVGIAGITVERATAVIEAGADSVAVITDFLRHHDPERRIVQWLDWAAERRQIRAG